MGARGPHGGFFLQHFADELSLAFEFDHFWQVATENFRWIAALQLLEQVAGKVQVSKLIIQELFPHRLDARIVFLIRTAFVGVNLHRFVKETKSIIATTRCSANALRTGTEKGAPPDLVETLQRIRNEEEEHFHMLVGAVEKMGADPTAMTPSADVVGVVALGVMQVLTDPRTNLSHGLNALLTVELADNAAWELLIELADKAGHGSMAKKFEKALNQEEEHLATIKGLLRQDQLDQL
jgi:ferritin-like metal-binding protein YciE